MGGGGSLITRRSLLIKDGEPFIEIVERFCCLSQSFFDIYQFRLLESISRMFMSPYSSSGCRMCSILMRIIRLMYALETN